MESSTSLAVYVSGHSDNLTDAKQALACLSNKSRASESMSDTVGRITDQYLLPLVMLIGIIGNILNILTLTRKEMLSPTVQILIAMSCSDLGVLLLQIPHVLTYLVFKEHHYQVLYNYYFVFCRYPLSNILFGFTLWLSVLVTLERCLAFNKRSKKAQGTLCGGLLQFCCSPKKQNATRLIACVFMCSFAFNCLRFFEYEVNQNFVRLPSLGACNASKLDTSAIKHRAFMRGTLSKVYFWMSATLHNFAPMIMLISFTYMLASRIRRHDRLKTRLATVSATKPAIVVTMTTESTTHPLAPHFLSTEDNRFMLSPRSCVDAAYSTMTTSSCSGDPRRLSRTVSRRYGFANHAALSRTVTVLVICIVILFLLTDSLAVYLAISIAIFSREVVFQSEVNRCLRHVSNLLVVTNSSCNFILFCSTSRQYRTLFVRTVNRCLCRAARNRNGAVFMISDRHSENSLALQSRHAVSSRVTNL